MAWRRRRYPPYDPRYDPRYSPYGGPGWGPGYGRGGGSCLRDACLLETGCCIGEALDNNCLLLAVLVVPQFVRAVSATPDAATTALSPVRVGRRSGPAGRVVAAVRVYQREISTRRPPVCRFTPSCSEYAVQAVEMHGVWRGGLLTMRRLVRCRPGGPRGHDPVPC